MRHSWRPTSLPCTAAPRPDRLPSPDESKDTVRFPRLHVTRLLAPAALVALVLAGYAAYADSPSRDLPADPADDLRLTASQPFAGLPDKEIRELDEIRRKLVHRCMVAAGYREYNGTDPEPLEQASPVVILNRDLIGWASEAHARAQAFGRNVPAEPVEVVSFDADHDAVLKGCVAEAGERIGPGYRKTVDRAISLLNEMSEEYSETVDASRVRELTAPLTACLADAGFDADAGEAKGIGLRPETFGVPTGAPEGGSREPALQREPGTLEVLPPTPARLYLPSPEESALAVAMFRCHHTTGVIDELRTIVNNAQQTVWNNHKAELQTLKPALTTLIHSGTTQL